MYFYINFFRDSYDSWSKNSLSFIVKQLCGYILYKTQIFFVLYYLNLRGFSWIRNFYKSVTSKKSHVFIVNKIRIYCTSLDYSKVIRREIKCFIIPQDSYTHTSVLCVLQLCMYRWFLLSFFVQRNKVQNISKRGESDADFQSSRNICAITTCCTELSTV